MDAFARIGRSSPRYDAGSFQALMEYIRQGADEIVTLPDAVAELVGVFGHG